MQAMYKRLHKVSKFNKSKQYVIVNQLTLHSGYWGAGTPIYRQRGTGLHRQWMGYATYRSVK